MPRAPTHCPRAPHCALPGLRVLLTCADPALGFRLRETLFEAGCDVREAVHAAAALRLCLTGSFDLLVAVDGPPLVEAGWLAEALRDRWPWLPAVLVAEAEPARMPGARAAGPTQLVRRPVLERPLLQAVARLACRSAAHGARHCSLGEGTGWVMRPSMARAPDRRVGRSGGI